MPAEPTRRVVTLDVEQLDKMIRNWRARRDGAPNERERLIASCYIDAYQCVRVNNGLILLT